MTAKTASALIVEGHTFYQVLLEERRRQPDMDGLGELIAESLKFLGELQALNRLGKPLPLGFVCPNFAM